MAITASQRRSNLCVPRGKVPVVLDTDAFNEIDDQFAIAYLLRAADKLDTKAIYAAPFLNSKVSSPAEGMEKSYGEILHLLELLGERRPVFRGSEAFLPDETTPVLSDAARDLAVRADAYSPQAPLYVVAIGAITNVASAILLNPKVAENTVVIWLGGHALHYHDTAEYNMRQDVAAARVVFSSGVPLIQLPCMGVVNLFAVSRPELEQYFYNKNPLADYLARNTVRYMDERREAMLWSKPIWDVTAVAWLLNDDDRFMLQRNIPTPIPGYDHRYAHGTYPHEMGYVYAIRRDALLEDLVDKLTK